VDRLQPQPVFLEAHAALQHDILPKIRAVRIAAVMREHRGGGALNAAAFMFVGHRPMNFTRRRFAHFSGGVIAAHLAGGVAYSAASAEADVVRRPSAPPTPGAP